MKLQKLIYLAYNHPVINKPFEFTLQGLEKAAYASKQEKKKKIIS